MKVITRFAPSPTGYLHVGGARTALFSYLYARHHGGQFELRIEDTDTERSTEASVNAIFEGMNWLGLEHDSEVKYQSKNLARYHEVIEQLLANDQAYYCDCSKARLDEMREAQMKKGEKPRYDGKCRNAGLEKSADTIIRFKTPQSGEVHFKDGVRGDITVANAELDDLVIARADGMPTYNFSVVIDDADMGITHVIRGDDHINNTPRQINIYKALDLPVPEFAHVPMILGDDGARLSKRHGAVSVMQYSDDGYLPEAVLNYLVRLGWSHGDQELFSKAEMIELFDLSGVNKAPSAFNTTKLNWINQQYLQQADDLRLVGLVQKRLETLGVHLPTELNLTQVVEMFKERAHTINELVDLGLFLLQPLDGYDEKAEKKAFKESAIEPLQAVIAKCEAIDDWAGADLHQLIADVVAELEVGFGKVGMPVRLALSGQAQGPANDEIMQVLGKDETINRLQNALSYLTEKFS
ncbi:glutamate--tRNA ligase [Marinicella sp. S1101]|uniref:glutamate--tRNA ligase n=1 Tax=Marinicella marina TaxID=2996016 RepID=UPI002260DC11|nr:glutamate--tRNA ligase [Marinicella marina]MCX7553838.1 glutamate--tRNA ligase [Marinicella marina]MDJ1140914.1 glutamate--tRNA ligase [Marinicella marina]